MDYGLDIATVSPNPGGSARRALIGAVVALAGVIAVYALFFGPGSRSGGVAPAKLNVPAEIPASSSAISRLLGADEHGFWAVPSKTGVRQRNTRQRLSVRYRPSGLELKVPQGAAGIVLGALGRAGHLSTVSPAPPAIRANRVTYHRGDGISEWYANGPLGLEQGLTLRRRTAGAAGAPLTFRFSLSGSLTPRIHGGVVTFTKPGSSAPLLSYRGLSATDATGRSLPARLTLSGRRLTIRVDDAGARYPITVDPTVQNAQLTGSDSIAGDQFGSAVAQSDAGDVVVVGAPRAKIGNNSFQGAAYVFVKPSKGWANATQTTKLSAPDGVAGDGFGTAVAIVGSAVVVGAPSVKVGTNYSQGAVYAFAKPAAGWTKPGAAVHLVPSVGGQGENFGATLASGGNHLYVGAPGAGATTPTGTPGAVFEYTQPGAGWKSSTPQTAMLTATDSNRLGTSLAASGATLVAGAPLTTVGATSYQGAAYVYAAPASGWKNATQTAKLTASDGAQYDFLGSSVAVFADTGTIALGAPDKKVGANQQSGAVYVYQEPKGGWRTATQTAEMTQAGAAAGTGLGHTVAITDKAGTGPPTAPGAKAADAGTPTITGWKISVVGGSSNGTGLTVWGSTPSGPGWVNLQAGTQVSLPIYGTGASAYSVNLGPGLMAIGNDSSNGSVVLIPAPPGAVQTNCYTAKASSLALGRPEAGAAIYVKNCNNSYAKTSSTLATVATYFFGGVAVLSAGVYALAEKTTEGAAVTGQAEVAVPAFFIGLAAAGISFTAYAINDDPPDRHYRTLVHLKIPRTRHIRPGRPFNKALTRRLQKLAANETKLNALANAGRISINRAGSAKTAKSNKWLGRQTRAAIGFLTRARALLGPVNKQIRSVQRAVSKVKPYSTTMAQFRAFGKSVKRHGLPKTIVRRLRKHGKTKAQIKSYGKKLATAGSLKGRGTLGKLLFTDAIKLDQNMVKMINLYKSYPPVIAAAKLH